MTHATKASEAILKTVYKPLWTRRLVFLGVWYLLGNATSLLVRYLVHGRAPSPADLVGVEQLLLSGPILATMSMQSWNTVAVTEDEILTRTPLGTTRAMRRAALDKLASERRTLFDRVAGTHTLRSYAGEKLELDVRSLGHRQAEALRREIGLSPSNGPG